MPKYPKVGKPQKQADGRYRVVCWRAPGDKDARYFDTRTRAEQAVAAADFFAAWLRPTPNAPRVISNVRGPTLDKRTGKWVLGWIENGENQLEAAEDKATLVSRREALERAAGITAVKLPKLPKDFDGSAAHCTRAIAQAMRALNDAARDGDERQMAMLRKYTKGLSEMSGEAHRHSEMSRFEEDYRQLVTFVEDLYKGRAEIQDATKSTIAGSVARTLRGRKGPIKTIH